MCEPFTRLGAQVIGVDPSASNIAAAKLHAEKGHLSIDYRCTTVEVMDARQRFDIVLAMEVVEHVSDVGLFLNRCAAMLKGSGDDGGLDAEPATGSSASLIVAPNTPRGARCTDEWGRVRHPDELAEQFRSTTWSSTEQSGVVDSRSPTMAVPSPTWT